LRSYGGLKSQDVEISLTTFARFWGKTTPYNNFQNYVPKVYMATPIDVVFKCRKVQWEIGEIVC